MRKDGVTKWAKEFTVSAARNAACKTSYSYIPKPVLDMLGSPRRITFAIQDGPIAVKSGSERGGPAKGRA